MVVILMIGIEILECNYVKLRESRQFVAEEECLTLSLILSSCV
jgi:hypothetical protein